MKEWERTAEGILRYVTCMTGKWDGMRVEGLYKCREHVVDSDFVLVLKDERSGRELSRFKTMVEIVSVDKTGAITARIQLGDVAGTDAMVYDEKGDFVQEWKYRDTKIGVKAEDYHMDALHMTAWLLLEMGYSQIIIGGSDPINGEDKEIENIKKSVGESKMDQFYDTGKADLAGGLKINIDLPTDWMEKGAGYVYVDLSLPDGEEAILEGFIWKSQEREVLPIELWIENVVVYSDKGEEEFILDAEEGLGEIEGETPSVLSDPARAMLYMTIRYLQQNYGELKVIMESGDNVPRQIKTDWEAMSDVVHKWMGF